MKKDFTFFRVLPKRVVNIAGWLLTNDPESRGVLGIRIAFFSHEIKSWIKTASLKETTLSLT